MCQFLEVAQEAARAGGRVLLDWRGRFSAREKGPSDLVTEADLAAQEAVRRTILGRFPKHGFLGEEEGGSIAGDGRHRWIVDPLDGTVNYVHGVPQFAVSIALQREGELVAGAIYDPVAQEMFSSAAGEGARLNGRKLQTSDVRELGEALVVASFPPGVTRDCPEVESFLEILVRSQSLRRSGSAALNLAYVAAGRYDGYWATSTHAWDIAAGVLLVREAGGVVTDLQGGAVDVDQAQVVAAGTKELHAELLPLVKSG